jgi:hypothetical protein
MPSGAIQMPFIRLYYRDLMKSSTALRTLLIAGLLASPGAVLHAQPAGVVGRPAEEVIQPGYWKYETRALVFLNDTDFRCVRPQDVRKFLAPCNRHNTCTYHVQDIADGNARYEGVWTDNDDGTTARVRAEGTYSEKRFDLNATIRAQRIPIPISGKITATWQSETCPAGARNP